MCQPIWRLCALALFGGHVVARLAALCWPVGGHVCVSLLVAMCVLAHLAAMSRLIWQPCVCVGPFGSHVSAHLAAVCVSAHLVPMSVGPFWRPCLGPCGGRVCVGPFGGYAC